MRFIIDSTNVYLILSELISDISKIISLFIKKTSYTQRYTTLYSLVKSNF